MENLIANTENAFLEIDNKKVIFNHFDNLKHFDRQQIEFQIDDVLGLKKAFRKDDSVNKLTLTVKNKNKVKIVIEDFENMEALVEILMEKMKDHKHVSPDC